MKERPILFSAPMVRALLAGTKTQTRRVVKPQPITRPGIDCTRLVMLDRKNRPAVDTWVGDQLNLCATLSPYGQPGDRLWVRESFWGCDLPGYGDQPCVVYDDEWHGKEYKPAEPRPWARKFGRIPSIHIPRECSRITLEIVSVRVERLNDISEADAMAEGISCDNVIVGCNCYGGHHVEESADRYFFDGCLDEGFESAVDAYMHLWDSINGPDSWSRNDWVWVLEFLRTKP